MANYAFIDSQNVNLAIQGLGWRLDLGRFRTYLKDKYVVHKAFLFIGYIPDRRRFYRYLQKSGYELVFKPVSYGLDGKIKGNVDAELVLQTMIEYVNFEQAVIVSGDGDFHCLVKYLHEQRKLCRLLIPNRQSYSFLLRPFIHSIDFLDELHEKLGLTKNPESH